MTTKEDKLDKERRYPPSDSCVICNRSFEEVGGERIIAQILRGIVISNTANLASGLFTPVEANEYTTYKLLENSDKYLVVWGEELQTDNVIEKAKREYTECKQPWFCEVCGNRICKECKVPIRFPMGCSMIDDSGDFWRVPLLPIDQGCINPKCKNYKRLSSKVII